MDNIYVRLQHNSRTPRLFIQVQAMTDEHVLYTYRTRDRKSGEWVNNNGKVSRKFFDMEYRRVPVHVKKDI